MSIINSFDNQSKPLVDINSFYEKNHYGDVCIFTFSRHVLNMFLEKYKSKCITNVGTSSGRIY